MLLWVFHRHQLTLTYTVAGTQTKYCSVCRAAQWAECTLNCPLWHIQRIHSVCLPIGAAPAIQRERLICTAGVLLSWRCSLNHYPHLQLSKKTHPLVQIYVQYLSTVSRTNDVQWLRTPSGTTEASNTHRAAELRTVHKTSVWKQAWGMNMFDADGLHS